MSIAVLSGDLVEIKVYCKLFTQVSVNVLHYYCTEGAEGTAATIIDFLGGFNITNTAKYQDCLCDTAQILGYTGARISGEEPTAAEVYNLTATFGNVAGDPLPPQVCGLISKRTPFAGRANRGRVYIPFPSEDDSTDAAVPVAGYMTNLQSLATALKSAIVAGVAPVSGTIAPVILHRATMDSVFTSAWLARSSWATQRRRSLLNPSDVSPF